MIYNLSYSYWRLLWNEKIPSYKWELKSVPNHMLDTVQYKEYYNRVDLWNKLFFPLYNISYKETLENFETGYYGQLIGEEKCIMWFLLTIDMITDDILS